MTSGENVFFQIAAAQSKKEHLSLSNYACRSKRGLRAIREKEDHGNIRAIFAHDADRIIHSLAYARYIDKTQVFYLFNNDHITHRALHVQFVSKIGRTIGRALRLNEDLIEAIALGHDLGHVPYGHDGEKVLDQICQNAGLGYFKHNAQSVRFLRQLEKEGQGLNLTLQVLDGILAHNGEILSEEYAPCRHKKWEDHEREYEACFSEKDGEKKISPMTLEGCVVRISDVLAYVGRDFEDAIVLEVIERTKMPLGIKKLLGDTNKDIINTLAMDLIKNSYGKDVLCFSKDVFSALTDLRKFNFEHIYFDERIKTETPKMERMFKMLYAHYLQCVRSEVRTSAIFTGFLDTMNQEYVKNTAAERMVIDFLSGMTDKFFNAEIDEIFVPKKLGYKLSTKA